jgi:hypothetical protein
LLVSLGLATAYAEPLSADSLESIKRLIAPSEDEQDWLSIPWETDLVVARAKAARDGKPVFLWEMDGHPLGCT